MNHSKPRCRSVIDNVTDKVTTSGAVGVAVLIGTDRPPTTSRRGGALLVDKVKQPTTLRPPTPLRPHRHLSILFLKTPQVSRPFSQVFSTPLS